MPERSVTDVLKAVASNPRSTFAVADLTSAAFDAFRPFARFLSEPVEGELLPCPTARGPACMRVLARVDDDLAAICPCPAREPPLPVTQADLVRFSLDIERIAESLARAYATTGTPAAVSARCWYLGMTQVDEARVALVLGLFDGRDAMGELRALRGILPDAADEIACLTPAFEPPLDAERMLAAIRVRVIPLAGFDGDRSLRDLLRPPARTVPLVTLSAEQEEEALTAGLLCHWPIIITGRIAKRGLNIVEINGKERHLGRAAFPLFMRLVTALFETANGYVPKGRMREAGGLAAEGYYRSDGMEPAIGRLRDALGPEFKSLVEVHNGAIRLSVHPAYVRCAPELETAHADPRVRDLVARMRGR